MTGMMIADPFVPDGPDAPEGPCGPMPPPGPLNAERGTQPSASAVLVPLGAEMERPNPIKTCDPLARQLIVGELLSPKLFRLKLFTSNWMRRPVLSANLRSGPFEA